MAWTSAAACILPSPWSSRSPRGPDRLLQLRKMSRKARIVRSFGTPDAEASFSVEAYRLMDASFDRRKLLLLSSIGFMVGNLKDALDNGMAVAAEYTDMPALRGKNYGKTKMRYPDYTETQSGLQYKDLRVGDGPAPKSGDTVVVDWDGYTIGYYGRIFEARNKTKGGSFVGDDKDFFKFKVGSNQVIPAFEEAIVGMAPGGVRSNAG